MSFATSEFQKLQNFSSVMCSSFVILGCSELLEILELRNFGIPRMTRLILRLWVFRKCCNACNRPMSCERLVLRGVSMQMYACVCMRVYLWRERERVCVYIYMRHTTWYCIPWDPRYAYTLRPMYSTNKHTRTSKSTHAHIHIRYIHWSAKMHMDHRKSVQGNV